MLLGESGSATDFDNRQAPLCWTHRAHRRPVSVRSRGAQWMAVPCSSSMRVVTPVARTVRVASMDA